MDVDQAVATVEQLWSDLEWKEEHLADLTRQVAGIRKLIATYYEMFPTLEARTNSRPPVVDQDSPKGAEAVRRILQAAPGEQLLVSQVVRALADAGWLPESDNPANAARAALDRLAATQDSDVHKLRYRTTSGIKVFYTYDPDRVPEEEPF